MSIIRARDGYVNGIPCVQSWATSKAATVQAYVASCTDRGTGITKGVINETGTISGIGGNPPITPGVEFTFKGVIDNTFGAAKVLDGTVLPTSLSITIDKETGGPITWTANFGVQGQLVEGSVGAADSNFILHDGASIVADPVLYNGGTPYPIPGFRNITFTIDCPEATYVQDGLTYRKPGNLSANMSIGVYNDDYIDAKVAPNVIDALKVFVDTEDFWEFEWFRFSDISGFTIDRATQALIGYSINAQWSAVNNGALGHITRPDGTHIFGV